MRDMGPVVTAATTIVAGVVRRAPPPDIIGLQFCRDIHHLSRFFKDHLVVVVVLVVIDIDGAVNIDLVFFPGHDTDGIRDLKIHRYKIFGRERDVFIDDLLRPGGGETDAQQCKAEISFHIAGLNGWSKFILCGDRYCC